MWPKPSAKAFLSAMRGCRAEAWWRQGGSLHQPSAMGKLRLGPYAWAFPPLLNCSSLPQDSGPEATWRSNLVKLLMILQSPLSQQSQKRQDHVLKISRYCWPRQSSSLEKEGSCETGNGAQAGLTLPPFTQSGSSSPLLPEPLPTASALGLPLTAPGMGSGGHL